MPRKFEPEKHCGAIGKNGQPCTRPKGSATDHPGEGCCYLHGDAAIVPVDVPVEAIAEVVVPIAVRHPNKARPANQNAVKHGLYARVLTGAAAVRFEAVQQHDPASILRESFCMVHARALGLLEGEGKFDRQAQTVLEACTVLVEAGELSEDFVKELELRLLNLDIERLARILNSTVNLANAAVFHERMGNLQRQYDRLMGYLQDSVRLGDRSIKELALQAIQELKLEAGLPLEELNMALQAIQEVKSGEDEEEA
ncbi:MAG: SCA7 domain-containing protein [Drouetiella hepatica Uher 2000/2452]|uniref:SCA7 domain-containing protein n=1 Tax=Drouetiella hepatica Uher 2000/2452 TaxID=904376 RepID=A0A951UNZ0_9CYAN|nr:SCA7 domain-containing protein [Drouetiella hepatica Uher 2000/2452]